jgi:nucleoside-diphosphate-sugar epimerase
MRIFITGATGYIGAAVAAAFARKGHNVFGLVRTPAKATRLAAAEGTPVAGNLHDPDGWRHAADACDVLVHCAVEYSEKQWDVHSGTVEALIDSARRAHRPRKLLVTSGVWVYGDTGDGVADETSALVPPALVTPRPAADDRVLDANGTLLRTLVLRPGCVYGGPGGMTASWFESAVKEGAARTVGDGANRWAMVHVEDLADLYVRAAESPFGGEVFNATDRSRFTVLDCARAASLAAGADGKTVSWPLAEAATALGAAFAECLALNQHVDSSKAVRLLGWQPRHGGFVDGAERYFQAWRAGAGG